MLSEEPRLADVWLAEVCETARSESAAVFVAGDTDETRVVGVYAVQSWESDLFGRANSVAHVRLIGGTNSVDAMAGVIDQAVQHARATGVSLMAVRVQADEMHAISRLTAAGFVLVDTLMDFVARPLGELCAPIAEGYAVRPATPDDMDEAVQLAADAFAQHFGRFHADPRIRPDEAARVYPEWIASAFRGYADAIFVAVHDHHIVGCSLWRAPTATAQRCDVSLGHYSLGVVSSAHAGRGLFKSLTVAGLNWHASRGVRYVEGPTHTKNLAVQRAYDQLGFQPAGQRWTYHRWLDR